MESTTPPPHLLVVAVSCGFDTCFAVKAFDGLYHLAKSMHRIETPFGFQWMVWTFVRHTVSRCLIFPALLEVAKVMLAIVNTISYLQFLSTGQHGLCFGYLFQVRSLYVPFINGPPLGVRFRESLVFRLHSKIDQIHLSIEAQCGTARLLKARLLKEPWRFQIYSITISAMHRIRAF